MTSHGVRLVPLVEVLQQMQLPWMKMMTMMKSEDCTKKGKMMFHMLQEGVEIAVEAGIAVAVMEVVIGRMNQALMLLDHEGVWIAALVMKEVLAVAREVKLIPESTSKFTRVYLHWVGVIII